MQMSMHMEDPYPTRGEHAAILERKDPVVHLRNRSGPRSSMRRHLDQFERDGYLFVPGLFDPEESGKLLKEATKLREAASAEHPQEAFFEAGTDCVRSIFSVHRSSEAFSAAFADRRLIDLVQLILDDDVYIHQSRLNYKPAFKGREFYWHSDFETWHAEDGMPRMRALSLSISLTPTLPTNGPLMLIPGSQNAFVACPGETPAEHYRESLVQQQLGTPDQRSIEYLARRHGIRAPTGEPGSAMFFDCNVMHASYGNMTPFPRINLFVVFNAVSNKLVAPFAAPAPRPEFIGARNHTPTLPRR